MKLKICIYIYIIYTYIYIYLYIHILKFKLMKSKQRFPMSQWNYINWISWNQKKDRCEFWIICQKSKQRISKIFLSNLVKSKQRTPSEICTKSHEVPMKSHEIHDIWAFLRGPRSCCSKSLDKSRKSALSPAEFAQGLSHSENMLGISYRLVAKNGG